MRFIEHKATTRWGGLVALALVGCSGLEPITPFEQITDPKQLYMQLVLNHGAVNLSTAASYNTLQLTATPIDALGAPMTGLPAPTFRSTDTTKVKVTEQGLVTAVQAVTGVSVIAELMAPGNVRHVDTAIVNVNVTAGLTPPVLTTFSIDPASPDSAIVAIEPGNSDFIVIGLWTPAITRLNTSLSLMARRRALDPVGDSIPGVTTEYASLDPTIATVERRTGMIKPLYPGRVRLVARTIAYGVSMADTTVFTVTMPSVQSVFISTRTPVIFGSPITIRSYGVVFWINQLNQPLDIVFDDPTLVAQPPAILCDIVQNPTAIAFSLNACGTGNFTMPASILGGYSGARVRQFPVPGTYNYRDMQTGAIGRIVVTDGPTP